jgi:hypothetical protein
MCAVFEKFKECRQIIYKSEQYRMHGVCEPRLLQNFERKGCDQQFVSELSNGDTLRYFKVGPKVFVFLRRKSDVDYHSLCTLEGCMWSSSSDIAIECMVSSWERTIYEAYKHRFSPVREHEIIRNLSHPFENMAIAE